MPFSVIGVSETWLTDCTAEHVNIRGYNFVSNHRKSKTGGGVGIYLQNGLEYKLLEECKFSDPDVIESLFLEKNYQTFLVLRRKCKSFYLNNPWIGLAAHS